MQQTGRSALRLLHYWWPLAVGWSFMVVAGRATGTRADPAGVLALLSGILAAYSVDRIADRTAASERRQVVPVLVVIGFAASLACALSTARLPLQTAALVPVLGGTTLLYPRLKRQALVKTLVLPAIWIWAALALPFNDGSWFGWHALLQPVAAPLLLLTAAGCVLCDLKDEARDRHDGVRSLAAVYGGPAAIRIAAVLALAAAGLAVVEHRSGLVCSAAALSAITLTPSLVTLDVIGPLMVDLILTLPGILISAHVV